MMRFFKIVVISIASLLIGIMILGIVGLVGFGLYNFVKGLFFRQG
jgi:hypothetical protein